MTERQKMTRRLAAADFALYETVLYLDGHPNDRKALEYLRTKRREADELRKQYESKYGGVSAASACADGRWGWVEGSWPWQNGRSDG